MRQNRIDATVKDKNKKGSEIAIIGQKDKIASVINVTMHKIGTTKMKNAVDSTAKKATMD